MESIVSFLVKSIACSAVLTAYYWIFLRNRKFHNYNRFYLLAVMALSLLLPLLHFSWITVNLPKFEERFLSTKQTISLIPIFKTLTVLISATLSIIFTARICRLYHIKQNNRYTGMNGFVLIETRLPQAPFSFLNNLYWRTDISFDDENGKKIYQHELIHIRQKHSYDKLFSQAIICLFWMNPFYWIIQKELNMVHEFIADAGSVPAGDVAYFAGMLLGSYNEGRHLDPAHCFSHSPVNRRLTMIADRSGSSFSFWRMFSAVPVLLVLILFITCLAQGTQQNKMQNNQQEAKMAAEKASLQTTEHTRKR